MTGINHLFGLLCVSNRFQPVIATERKANQNGGFLFYGDSYEQTL
jgi:hypothetical protein